MSRPPALTEADAAAHLADVPGWELGGWECDRPCLRRRFEFPDFRAALKFVNRVGMLAEEANHHPDFHLTGWNKVELVLTTHDVGGLTQLDFDLARKIDTL